MRGWTFIAQACRRREGKSRGQKPVPQESPDHHALDRFVPKPCPDWRASFPCVTSGAGNRGRGPNPLRPGGRVRMDAPVRRGIRPCPGPIWPGTDSAAGDRHDTPGAGMDLDIQAIGIMLHRDRHIRTIDPHGSPARKGIGHRAADHMLILPGIASPTIIGARMGLRPGLRARPDDRFGARLPDRPDDRIRLRGGPDDRIAMGVRRIRVLLYAGTQKGHSRKQCNDTHDPNPSRMLFSSQDDP